MLIASVHGLKFLDYATGRVVSSLQFKGLVGALVYQSACCIGVVAMRTLPSRHFTSVDVVDVVYIMCVGMHVWMYMHLSR